ncbi:MAG: endo-1,4-beta-xylanase [Elainella sp. Prado103]|jgi:endo-1,4-beta-xylanase|nr:endo-1,4-beta-xylanase [Elainella sp. Prado103]
MYSRYSRRRALTLGAGVLSGIGTVIGAKAGVKAAYRHYQAQILDNPDRTFETAGETPLKQRAQAKGLIYGAAARHQDLMTDRTLATHYRTECALLAPEWELKWSAGNARLRTAPNQFDFTMADEMINFAQTHAMQVRGNTLVWHLCLPEWFTEQVNHQNAEQWLVQHIQTVVGRYAGQVQSWDVVNEAIEPADGQAHGLRRTPWQELLDADYIDLAFRIAAAADPKAVLTYNDYGLEYDTPENQTKRQAVLQLLERLKAQGTPIHALGIQSHLVGNELRFNPQKLRQFLSDVASLGLKIFITELDVIDRELPQSVEVRDRIIASIYEDFLSVILDEPAVKMLVTWGLSDRYSWLTEFHPRADGSAVRPLPLDGNLQRKSAWRAIARAIDAAPVRSSQSACFRSSNHSFALEQPHLRAIKGLGLNH